MVRRFDRIRIYKDERFLEVNALFDTGSSESYLSEGVAEKVGYERYEKPLKVPLAVEGYDAEIIGYSTCFLEIAGYRLPTIKVLGVIKGLRVDAIIGIDIIEPYEITLEKDQITFKRSPPGPYLF